MPGLGQGMQMTYLRANPVRCCENDLLLLVQKSARQYGITQPGLESILLRA
jgi:hypothetical protein